MIEQLIKQISPETAGRRGGNKKRRPFRRRQNQQLLITH